MVFSGEEENELSLHVDRYSTPTLLVAADRLEGDAQEIGNLFLGFVQFFADVEEFLAVHGPHMGNEGGCYFCGIVAKTIA